MVVSDVIDLGERAVVFRCHGKELVGIVALPRVPACATGLVIVVGGPQYRVGSHRQFTLLARHLADNGIASIRFDYRGYGDSSGQASQGIDGIEDDLRAAIDVLLREAPACRQVALWGLCGAATANALYAPADARVAGLVLLNPYVRTAQGQAKAQLRHYYLHQFYDREFWRRLTRGDVAIATSVGGLVSSALKAVGMARERGGTDSARPVEGAVNPPETADARPLPDRMLAALRSASLPALLILSGDADFTANEFRDLRSRSKPWRRWLAAAQVQSAEIAGSNHTFARSDWRARVEELTTQWVSRLPA